MNDNRTGQREAADRGERTCGTALWGWAPPDLPASGVWARRIDRLLPRTGIGCLAYFGAVIGLLLLAPHLPLRPGLAVDGLAALAASAWCGVNFWLCRHAHCAVTVAGWLALSVVAFAGAAVGHSLTGGYEQPIFVGVLLAGIAFETVWRLARGTNALR